MIGKQIALHRVIMTLVATREIIIRTKMIGRLPEQLQQQGNFFKKLFTWIEQHSEESVD
ncbi:hypothetical protein [Metasolibacillus fluoroglycofenilyticus]|uniref:hypothetical protein n=1 Tax=Metasolibacillus fluoroglycofenilyticus TaxID=1239396 RepID=UPI001379F4AE|nr:hypothetical protein [Metasolibacillus fluoroglycofenilyticus]